MFERPEISKPYVLGESFYVEVLNAPLPEPESVSVTPRLFLGQKQDLLYPLLNALEVTSVLEDRLRDHELMGVVCFATVPEEFVYVFQRAPSGIDTTADGVGTVQIFSHRQLNLLMSGGRVADEDIVKIAPGDQPRAVVLPESGQRLSQCTVEVPKSGGITCTPTAWERKPAIQVMYRRSPRRPTARLPIPDKG